MVKENSETIRPKLENSVPEAQSYLTGLLMRATEKEINENERKAMQRVVDSLRNAE